jgi:phage head maturation protease
MRATTPFTVSGFVVRYGIPYRHDGRIEIVEPGAAALTAARDAMHLTLGRHGGPILGRTTDGSLRLDSCRAGLWFEASIDRADVDRVRRLHHASWAGYMRESWEDQRGLPTDPSSAAVHRILELELHEVTLTASPANRDTTATLTMYAPAA